MCGVAGVFGAGAERTTAEAMVFTQHHRGPDACGVYADPSGNAVLGHNRLSILDLSAAGTQPMASADGRLRISFNGEIYNYLELRAELGDYPFRTRTDTEVILAAYERWGSACLDRLIGMFAFLLWDTREQRLFAARDRFGVKPLYFHHRHDGGLSAASEIKALWAAGVAARPDDVSWATYLTLGLHDHSARTFWQGIQALPPGYALTWQSGRVTVTRWYDLAERAGSDYDQRPAVAVAEEYLSLLRESVRLRFRSDVPVGVNLSGGLDSSLLLGLIQSVQGVENAVTAFTFVTGDPAYDELPWVERMLARTRHPLTVCRLTAEEVPELASAVQAYQDEPFGGLPTLAYARLFEQAREHGIPVLLDGQGMDEQWCGYDYYTAAHRAASPVVVQGSKESPVRPGAVAAELRALVQPFEPAAPFSDRLRDLQYRDARHTKIPRALRFNDRVSMRASVELREPFLDHRLFELALRQPADRKIAGQTRKVLLRTIAADLLPGVLADAPKRPVQTPQREWLRGPLRDWADDLIETAVGAYGGAWLDTAAVRREWRGYADGVGDTSFFIWQWISLGLMVEQQVAGCAP